MRVAQDQPCHGAGKKDGPRTALRAAQLLIVNQCAERATPIDDADTIRVLDEGNMVSGNLQGRCIGDG